MRIVELLFQKRREWTALAVCVAISLALLIFPQYIKVSFAQKTLNALFLPIEKFSHFVDDYREIRGENRRLKRMVASLMLERERLLQYRDERERLRKFAAFKEEQFFKLLPCEVIGTNFERFQTMLIIDKGERDSLRTGMPVLSYQGYVGKIIKVYPTSAWVQLIRSRNFSVSCIDKRSRVVGILEWKKRSFFELKDVGIAEDVRVGDTLITSGFGGVVPKGFKVAAVTKVGKAIDELTLRIDAASDIKFRSLEEVFVMLDKIPWDDGVFYDSEDKRIYRKAIEEDK
jgi:rod shape-determining protein MreC